MWPEAIDHIGIAVKDLEQAIQTYSRLLGQPAQRESLPDRHLEIAFFPLGESRVELVSPTSPDSAISNFLEKRGDGLHHIAYRVQDIEAALAHARAQGWRLIDERPRPGPHGALVAFVHPSCLNGVLSEFVAYPQR
jgi:methylmalonyl-CoA/ethylmalonyl-CoA epimerase